MKKLFLGFIVCIVTSLCLAEAPGEKLLNQWHQDLEANFRDRIFAATRQGTFDLIIKDMPATQKMLALQDLNERITLEKKLLAGIVAQCHEDHQVTKYGESYYDLLFCHLKGISPNHLLKVSSTHEMHLTFVLAAIYADQEPDPSK